MILPRENQVRECNAFLHCFFAVYVALKNIFGIQTNALTPLLQIIVLLFAAFALWNITDIIVDKIQPKGIYSRSFAIYAMHINVSAIITKLIYLCLPKSEWLAIPNFVVTVVLTLLSINLFCAFSERFCPRIYSVLMGRRLR